MTNDISTPPVHEQTAQNTPMSNGHDSRSNGSDKDLAEKKLTAKLRDSVDDRGNYRYKLNDLSLGYAVGKGIDQHEAKQEIRNLFEREYGVEIKTYLENHREARGLKVDRDNGRGH